MKKTNQIPTPHIEAGDCSNIAKTVLMPGDPLRAKFIADTFFENVVQFNQVRGMLGFTGEYKGKKISVMGSGMGMPSIGIYSYELFNFYQVDTILRVGSCGAMSPDINLMDIILVDKSFSQSTYAKVAFGYDSEYMVGADQLNQHILHTAKTLGKKVVFGNIESGDAFYRPNQDVFNSEVKEQKILAGEMESFALFANAKYLGKNAGCLLTVSDSIVKGTGISSERRQNSFIEMMEIALETCI